MPTEVFDVLVIGSGAGGGSAACTLAELGLRVCMIEEGEHVSRSEFTNVPSQMIRRLYRDAGATAIIGRPLIQYAEGKCVGGSTLINGGMCWRTPDHVLQKWSSLLASESLSPEHMTPLFADVEEENSVRLQDPESLGKDNHLFLKTAEQLGWKIRANTRNQLHCAGTNNCVIGCPTGAKQSSLEAYVPRFLRAGGALLSSTKAISLQHFGGTASGVHVQSHKTRERQFLRARAVIISAGSVYTPLLLRASGLRNKHLGRHLFLHPTLKTVGDYDVEINMWRGVHQSHQVTEFREDGILLASGSVPPSVIALGLPGHGKEHGEIMERYNNMVVVGAQIEDTTTGRLRSVFGRPLLTYFITPADVARAKRAVRHAAHMQFTAGARRVFLPFHGLPCIERDGGLEIYDRYALRAGEIEMLSVHLMGTCRMGTDATQGVVDPFGRVHGTKNIFVADASVFPTPLGVNPMQTIWALAKRTSQHIVENRAKYLM